MTHKRLKPACLLALSVGHAHAISQPTRTHNNPQKHCYKLLQISLQKHVDKCKNIPYTRVSLAGRANHCINERQTVKKLTTKQINKWLNSLPETTPVWATMCADGVTLEQAKALDERRSEYRSAAAKLYADLERLDSLLCANADSDAGENMPVELNDAEMLGYYKYFRNHLANAAAVHWEGAGRDLNAELGYVAY